MSADPDFLQSILRNFISNARRYSQKGGILVGARRDGKTHVRLEVWDTGPGIPEDQQTKLFEEFERLTEQDNMGIRGAGLGLAVARRMAALMDTRIDVRSWVGRGSVFSVRLPRVDARVAMAKRTARAPSQPAGQSLSGLNVLCVDDEKLILDGMRALLEHWGCRVHTAQTAEDARSIIAREPIKVIIADYQLKQAVTGLDLLIALTAEDPDLHVSLLTAEATAELSTKASENNIMLLRKPADPNEIRQFLTHADERNAPHAAE